MKIRDLAKQLLDRSISRRSFINAAIATGLTSTTARSFAENLGDGKDAFIDWPLKGKPEAKITTEGMTGGEVNVAFLREWNIPYVFGLGGSEEVGLLDALAAQDDIRFVQALHESIVVAMADGYSRASGQTPFVQLHSVAGVAYGLGQIVTAYKDQSSMVIVAGRQSKRLRGWGSFLEAPKLEALPEQYCRWTWDIVDDRTVATMLRRAFLLAEHTPGGPVFVTFGTDFWKDEVRVNEIIPRSKSQGRFKINPDQHLVSEATKLLMTAQNPAIIAGRDVRPEAINALLEITERVGAAIYTDFIGAHSAQVIPVSHSHYAGSFGETTELPDHDVIWSVGHMPFAEMEESEGFEYRIPRSAKIINTNHNEAKIARNYPVDIAMLSDTTLATDAVLDLLLEKDYSHSDPARVEMISGWHRKRQAKLSSDAKKAWDNSPIESARLALELNERLDEDAILVTEMVTSVAYFKHYIDIGLKGPKRRQELTSQGGVLGWAVPAAIGAKIAKPATQVIAMTGDGSFQFSVQALWSAARYEVPVGIVVWNNNGYQANRLFLHKYNRHAVTTGRYIGSALDNPTIKIGKICEGIWGEVHSM